MSRFFKVRLVTQSGQRIEVGVAANDGVTAMDRAWIDYRTAHPNVRLAGGATLCTISKAEYEQLRVGAPSAVRLILVGCVKAKLDHPAPARDLYTSPLFRKRRAYAEASGKPWAILSAAHGLVWPDEEIRPYDVTLNDFRSSEREMWGTRVAAALREHVQRGDVIEVHAGEKYIDGLYWPVVRGLGVELETPLRGLAIGKQLGWYATPVAA